MILPMKKVCLMVQDKQQTQALTKLREVGVMHIEQTKTPTDLLSSAIEQKVRVENAVKIITPYKTSQKKKPEIPAGQPSPESATKLLIELGDERKALEEQQATLTREQRRIEAWGNFDPQDILELTAEGIPVFLYELTPETVKTLPEEIRYITLSEQKSMVRMLVFDAEIPGWPSFRLPETSLAHINAELAGIQVKINAVDKNLEAALAHWSLLQEELAQANSEVNFEAARAELEQVSDLPAQYSVSHFTGYVPSEDLGRLKAAAAENHWALTAVDPGEEDKVPTKLKNNRFSSLLKPLTGFLEILPGYREVDITGWFLLYFTIFFGMIFGDAVYGGLILIASIVGICKTAKKGVPPILKLMLLLGTSNFIWGVLTCTWMGIDAVKLPMLLQSISLAPISNVTAAISEYHDGIVRQNIMIICFTLALTQLSIGRIIAMFQYKSLKFLGELGALAMVIGMYGLILSMIASNEYRQIPLLMPFIYALGIGFVVNFIFANYEGSIGKSILESLKNFISMILGVANVFGDIMSYIRLWAVGLAGAAISSTVMTMAGPMLGSLILFIFGIVLLVFGHSLNLVLNALSVLVHGVRLNTLEFSSHLGLNWEGFAYKPFAKGGKK